jgi:G3E family GTPase
MMPLVLLAGFLGAGKTRLLSQLIPALHARGTRSRVILNDFENATIDAARLGELEALVTPLNGECVCCGSLRELLDTLYAVPPEADDERAVMFIEANGATETDELLSHLSADARLSHFSLPLQVTVVDAGRWQRRWWHNGLERAQVSTATHLVLNWTERLGPASTQRVRDALTALNPRASQTDAIALAEELDTLTRSLRGASATHRGQQVHAVAVANATHPHRHPFGSATLPLPDVVDRRQFTAFVQQMPESVVRAKGLVRFADEPGPMFVWHRVPGRRQVRFDRSWPHAEAAPTALFIGVDLPLDALQGMIQALDQASQPDTATSHTATPHTATPYTAP